MILSHPRKKKVQIKGLLKQQIYHAILRIFNHVLIIILKNRVYGSSVLHISYMVHVPYYIVRILRKEGLKADYLAVGETGPTWSKSDFKFIPSDRPALRAIQEFVCFWKILTKYEVIHSHFMITPSNSGWELPWLKRMGRKVVIHYRGCEIRDRDINMSLHTEYNICEECDYSAYCISEGVREKRRLARKYGDKFLVTTPDLKQFLPEAIHVPFITPEISQKVSGKSRRTKQDGIRILHVTNHPGIEGTKQIERVIGRLKGMGYRVNFVVLNGVHHERVLRQLSEADLSIGKMKMGYYANFQIESMLMGVPAVTYVRPEYMNEDLRKSGFIFTDLKNLEKTLKYYLDNPQELEQKRKIARDSILKIHDNRRIARQLISIYEKVKA